MRKKHDVVLCDTNVIIRYLLEESTDLGIKAKEVFDKIQIGELKAIILEAVFTECVYILEKVYKVPKDLLVDSLIGLLQYKGIINEDKSELTSALELFLNSKLHVVDCLLSTKSKAYNMKLISFDKELIKINELNN